MKKIALLAALGCLVLASCQQSTSNSSGPKTLSLTDTSTSQTTYQYYDLSTGAVVTDPASQSWDIAFSSTTDGVLTNSGVTATSLSSNGQGGVYYAGTSDFDTVASYTASKFSDAYATDSTIYDSTTTDGINYTTKAKVVNQITKLEYDGGAGTQADPFTYSDLAAAYGGTAYYSYDGGSHVISASGEVYIVRHGDGSHYSKLQVTSMTGSNSSRVRVIKYANF